MLVTACIGFTAWEALTAGDHPPEMRIEVTEVVPQAENFLVRIRVFNEGGSAAARLKVHGELSQGSDPIERSEATFDYLPSRSSRSAGLIFRRDPRALTLQLRAVGYEEP